MTTRQTVAVGLALSCLGCACLVLAPLPGVTTALLALPVVLVVPGLCVVRRAGIREPLIEIALAFPISAALCVAVAEAGLYLRWWHPKAAIVGLLVASAAALIAELRPRKGQA
jgi:hypothetical protein